LLASLNTEGARKELTQILKDSPKNVSARLQLGSLALQQKKYPEAISILNGLKENGGAPAYTGLVEAYARAGQIDKAVEVANEGLKRFPDANLIREQLALSAAMSGKFDLAVVQFQKVIAAEPKTVANYVRLGAIFDMQGAYPQAIQTFQQAHDLVPNDLGPALTLAQELAKTGRRADANTAFQEILRVHPNDPTALNNTAYFLCENGGTCT
jgi:pentatricopeptide repeat protein